MLTLVFNPIDNMFMWNFLILPLLLPLSFHPSKASLNVFNINSFVTLIFYRFDHFNIIRQGFLLAIDTFGVSHILPILGIPFIVVLKLQNCKKRVSEDNIFLHLTQVIAWYAIHPFFLSSCFPQLSVFMYAMYSTFLFAYLNHIHFILLRLV